MNRERYDDAAKVFEDVLNKYGRYVGCDVEAAFYLVVCYGQEREKEKAIAAASAFLKDYPDAPERFKKAMEQIKNELVQEWESPLYDLAGRMNHVAKKIDGGETGKPTQDKQTEIVGILDELIKKAKQQEGQGQGQGGGGGRPRGNQQPSGPANQSSASPGAAEVRNLRPKPKRKPGEQWGQMRDKEREEVLQALKEKFPDRYRELLEQYNKALAEGKRVTEPTEER
jgi:tetratricopeptide (TPR) repeat protein